MYIPETVVFQLKYGAIRNNKMILVRLIVAHIVTSTTDPEQSSEKKHTQDIIRLIILKKP